MSAATKPSDALREAKAHVAVGSHHYSTDRKREELWKRLGAAIPEAERLEAIADALTPQTVESVERLIEDADLQIAGDKEVREDRDRCRAALERLTTWPSGEVRDFARAALKGEA